MVVPVALSTASAYPQGCADAFEMAARLGYDGVEVMVWSDPVSQDVDAVAELVQHYGVPVLSVHAPTLLLTQRVWGREPWPKVTRAAQMAHRLGADTVVVHPPFRWQREYAAGFVPGVRELADREGVVIAVENMYPWRARSREFAAYAPGWDPCLLDYDAMTLDVSHASTAGVDSLELARRMGDRLAHLHLTDGTGSPKDEHLLPGRGDQPVEALLDHLVDSAWEGTVVVEVSTRTSRSPGEREADLAEALAFTRRSLAAPGLARRAPARAPAGVPDGAQDVMG
ncbi:sugar phosphate isomerase/epimerase [Quadrisphaera sp. DSM 44207]|uniref:sugar phosphate isomerase/epimerase family protein n=1 Tax=Quadrisphaera sp. DSM 44207 TaxID=1881057 RepID=UPI00088A580A|nr:sugar phosphate isomerase/epimerase [Quadrisphaera sp. DSM 44207]SDQ16238.1 Sugar phosphate isomerase/epimerase [Quadrisphaera sp. DSM 44207]